MLQQECTGGKTTVYGGRGGGGRSRRAASQVRQQASEVGLKGSRGLGGLNLKRGLQVSSPWGQCTTCRWVRVSHSAFIIGKSRLSRNSESIRFLKVIIILTCLSLVHSQCIKSQRQRPPPNFSKKHTSTYSKASSAYWSTTFDIGFLQSIFFFSVAFHHF